MATTPFRILIRRDTAANWDVKNPILLLDEIGLITDGPPENRRFKIGNGITPFRLLPWGNVTGPEGKVLVFISSEIENRLVYGPDGGLYVPEYTTANPLAYYNLAKG